MSQKEDLLLISEKILPQKYPDIFSQTVALPAKPAAWHGWKNPYRTV